MWDKWKKKLLTIKGDAQMFNPRYPFLYFFSNSSNTYLVKKNMISNGFDVSFAEKYNMSSIHKNLLFSAGLNRNNLNLDSPPANILVDSGGFQIYTTERKGKEVPFTPKQVFEWQLNNGDFIVILDRPAKGDVSKEFIKSAAEFTHKNTLNLIKLMKSKHVEKPIFFVFQLGMGHVDEYEIWFNTVTEGIEFSSTFYGVAISVWNFGDLPFLLLYHTKPILYLLFNKHIEHINHIHYLPMISREDTIPYLSYFFHKLMREGYVDIVSGDNSTPVYTATKSVAYVDGKTVRISMSSNESFGESLPFYCSCPFCRYMRSNFSSWSEVKKYHEGIFYHFLTGHNLYALNAKLSNLWEKWKYDSNFQSKDEFKRWQDAVDEAVDNQHSPIEFEDKFLRKTKSKVNKLW